MVLLSTLVLLFSTVSIASSNRLRCNRPSGDHVLDQMTKFFQAVPSKPNTCESELSYADMVAATEAIFNSADKDSNEHLDSVCLQNIDTHSPIHTIRIT